MPIIYTYPTVVPTSDDLVVLSDVSVSGNPTKTATISSLLDLGSTGIISNKTTISSVELLALVATPKEIIAAPGAGKAIQIVGPVYASVNNGSTPYAGTSTLLYVGKGGTFNYGILTGAVDKTTWDIQGSNKDSWLENKAITVYPNGTVINGDGTLDIYVNYRIITL